MSKSQVVKVVPKKARGFNVGLFFGLLGISPKWTIVCGNCEGVFKKRLPKVNNPGLQCPYCKAINQLPIEYG